MGRISRLQGTSCIMEYHPELLYYWKKDYEGTHSTKYDYEYKPTRYCYYKDRFDKCTHQLNEGNKCKMDGCRFFITPYNFKHRKKKKKKHDINNENTSTQVSIEELCLNTPCKAIKQNTPNPQSEVHIDAHKIEEKLNTILNFYFSRTIKFNESNGLFTLTTLEGEKLKFIPYDILQEIYRDKDSNNKYQKLKELCKD